MNVAVLLAPPIIHTPSLTHTHTHTRRDLKVENLLLDGNMDVKIIGE